MLFHIPGSDHRVVQICDLSQHPPPTWHLPSPLVVPSISTKSHETASTEQPPLKPGPQIVHQEAGVPSKEEVPCLPKSARLTRQTSDCQSKLRTELLAHSPHWEDGFPGDGGKCFGPASLTALLCCLINYPGKKKRKTGTLFFSF